MKTTIQRSLCFSNLRSNEKTVYIDWFCQINVNFSRGLARRCDVDSERRRTDGVNAFRDDDAVGGRRLPPHAASSEGRSDAGPSPAHTLIPLQRLHSLAFGFKTSAYRRRPSFLASRRCIQGYPDTLAFQLCFTCTVSNPCPSPGKAS
jgi:hypothetical protein